MNIEDALLSLEAQTAKLAQAQYKSELRLAKVEEGFKRIAETHQAVVQMLGLHEGRLDAGDEAQEHTDGRLDALLDAQIDFSQRLAEIASIQAAHRLEAEDRGARLDEKITRLAEAQAHAAEQIKLLMERKTDQSD